MALMLQGRQRQVVVSTLRFANLKQIESEAQVQRFFAAEGIADFRGWKPMGLAAYVNMHTVVRDWLERIAPRGRYDTPLGAAPALEQRAVTAEVVKALRSVSIELRFEKGELSFAHSFGSASAMLAFGVALILDKHRALTSRLQQCGYCKKFNLDLNTKGRPRRFCSPKHKALYDWSTSAERSRESRRAAKARSEAKSRSKHKEQRKP